MKLAFLGVGAMGSALAKGVVSSGFRAPEDVVIFDPDSRRLSETSTATGIAAAASARDAAAFAEAIIICVKPAMVESLLKEMAEVIEPGKLVISIAAGVRLERMQACLREGVGVIRVMPNTPAQVGMGASALALGKSVNQRQRDTAAGLCESVGLAVVVDGKLLDAVTGLSGSGPAFVYTFIEALADAGVSVGLTREAAIALAAQTVAGAAQMVLKTGRHPAVLRDQVTSPAGTTIAGCAELERKGLRAAVISAVQAAAARSAEMGK